MSTSYLGVDVIGNFAEADAREFLQWKLDRRRNGGKLDDEAWARVYEVGLLSTGCPLFPLQLS